MTGNDSIPPGGTAGPPQPVRPSSIQWISAAGLLIGLLNLMRLVQAARQWGFLERLLPVPVIYLVLSGLVWTAAGIIVAWGLWRGETWAPFFTRLAALAYAIYYWVDRLLIGNPESRPLNWPFAAALTLLGLALVFGAFATRKVKQFFGESDVDRPQNRTTA